MPVLAPSPFAPASPALASEYFPYCRTGSSFLNLLLARHRSDLCKLCAEHLQRLLDDRMRPRLLEEDQPLLFFLRGSELRHRRSWGIGLRQFDNPQPNRLPAQSFTGFDERPRAGTVFSTAVDFDGIGATCAGAVG